MCDLTKTEILEKIKEHRDKLKFYENQLENIEVSKIIENLKIFLINILIWMKNYLTLILN
jgi:hypothetical protein